jgi:hypothetical protein
MTTKNIPTPRTDAILLMGKSAIITSHRNIERELTEVRQQNVPLIAALKNIVNMWDFLDQAIDSAMEQTKEGE